MESASLRRQGFIDKEKVLPFIHRGAAQSVLAQTGAFFVALGIATVAYAAYVTSALVQAPATSGTVQALPLDASVSIVRDARDVPHVRAATQHDLFFAQGYVEGSDRLFQMDLVRRFIYGRLAEVLGPLQLTLDEQNRYLDARDIALRQWESLPRAERGALQAFSDGVNAAMRSQPLPVEFRLLLYEPERWRPVDSLAILLAADASVSDWPGDVLARDRLWRTLGRRRFAQDYPLSDGNYDRPRSLVPGSNAWAVGAALTASRHALMANDPHLDTYLPSVWYLIELRAPHFHVAGACIPGIPGVMLGHDDHVAWGTTNALAATVSVFRTQFSSRYWQREVFRVRLGRSVARRYYRTPDGFGFGDALDHGKGLLVRWQPLFDKGSPLTTLLRMDRARSVRDALRILATYAGPPQNFVLADDGGNVAYHLAGSIPDDPAWGRYVHADTSLMHAVAPVAYARLPATAPSKNGIVISANNKMYGADYPYRLSAAFAPPYRAYRIAHLLAVRKRYDVAYFTRMQMDAFSAIDLEFARRLARYAALHPQLLPVPVRRQLAGWDGMMSSSSKTATLVHALRVGALDKSDAPFGVLAQLRRGTLPPETADSIRSTVGLDWQHTLSRPWSQSGAITVANPLGLLRIPFLGGYTLPGLGDEQTLHVQSPGFAQTFRAVWEPGNWEAGGIAIPGGESGVPASRHYTDLTADWIDGRLTALPFSERAVRIAAVARLTLLPVEK